MSRNSYNMYADPAALNDKLRGDRVIHGMDGSNDKTIVAVMGQPKTADRLIGLLGCIADDFENPMPIAQPLKCMTSMHRTDLFGRFADFALNSLVYSDGSRVFNAQFFSCRESTGHRDAMHELEHAIKWAKQPFTLKALPVTAYAAAACTRREDAYATYQDVWAAAPWYHVLKAAVAEGPIVVDKYEPRSACSSPVYKLKRNEPTYELEPNVKRRMPLDVPPPPPPLRRKQAAR